MLCGLAASLFAKRADSSVIESLEIALGKLGKCMKDENSSALLKWKNERRK
jgi:hypothetical protein